MMTFSECHAKCSEMIVDSKWQLQVSAWGDGDVRWQLWLAARSKHIEASNPNHLIELLECTLRSTVDTVKMRPTEVAA